jgi:hypothetical protein
MCIVTCLVKGQGCHSPESEVDTKIIKHRALGESIFVGLPRERLGLHTDFSDGIDGARVSAAKFLHSLRFGRAE